ncbi:MAG TPA: class I SAM-dependent methyltransferase [Ardenticatenaceae bacterium]|nr:class I SAM-dependent methyltransferase [Ardenticatenaceae bacterium]
MAIRRLMLWAFDRLYNEAAWAYDLAAVVAGGEYWYEWGRAVLPLVTDDPVLEVGPGRGRFLLDLAHARHHAVGIELSAAMLRYARAHVSNHGLHVPLVRGSGMALPFADGTFATLITTFPAPYVGERATQREFARVLRPGGRWLWVDAPRAEGPVSLRGGLTTLFGPTPPVEDNRMEAYLRRDESGCFDVSVERIAVGSTSVAIRSAVRP